MAGWNDQVSLIGLLTDEATVAFPGLGVNPHPKSKLNPAFIPESQGNHTAVGFDGVKTSDSGRILI